MSYTDLDLPSEGDSSAVVSQRVADARAAQEKRFAEHNDLRQNADAEGALLEEIATPDEAGREILIKAADRFGLSARGYHRILRVARTIADLEGSDQVQRPHVAEALSFRLTAKVAA